MSSWRDRLVWVESDNQQRKKASFRGVPFFIRDSDRSIGRRNVVHQYPFKDVPYVEDLGQDADEFIVNGYVVQNEDNGQDYIDERDALIKALREPGPGTLIHPYYGGLWVSLSGKARVEESFIQGGIARFTMAFILVTEAGQAKAKVIPFPKTETDYVEAVDDKAEESLDAAEDEFSEKADLEDMPSYAENSIMDAVDSYKGMLQTVSKLVQGAFPSQISASLAYLTKAYLGIDLATLSDVCALASGIGDMFNGLKSIAGMYGDLLSDQLLGSCSGTVKSFFSGPMATTVEVKATEGFEASTMEKPLKINENLGKTTVRAMLAVNCFGESEGDANSIYGGTIPSVTITTAQKARQAANLNVIVNLVRINAIIVAMRTAVRINYSSYDSVMEMMEEVVGELESLLLRLGNDAADTDYDGYNITVASPASYQALVGLRPVFVEAMIALGASLAKIIDYEVPPTTMPTLILAYDKYFDLDRESEIIGRNVSLIDHPGFLPGGKTIEILNL